ncbi:MAG: STM4012 family radical SAM protein [Candidatus Lokiarchaeota archaeon]|nr:STM4012 family radical SAM protein [Candidatus Lokiarchaeota archaeon]
MNQTSDVSSIEELFVNEPFKSYAYAYPHKTTYRAFSPPLQLKDLWSKERIDALFLYFHIPFCETKCSYCNLFSTSKQINGLVSKYFDTLRRQSEIIMDILKNAKIATMAIGGGTPTLISSSQLHQLFDIAKEIFKVDPLKVPISVETSPKTISPEKISILKERGVERISVGVQTFNEAETRALGRLQSKEEVSNALDLIKSHDFNRLNIDLIYGIPEQTLSSFVRSIESALIYNPEEIYLYPLYIRPLTPLGNKKNDNEDKRILFYRKGRQILLEHGYMQHSMRMFRLKTKGSPSCSSYSCQEDGMIGMGCGSRSYTKKVHYSEEYAVKQESILKILTNYIKKPNKMFQQALHGIKLTLEDQKRRYVLKSILKEPGLSLNDFHKFFNIDALDAMPELLQLMKQGYIDQVGNYLKMTEQGLERSDVISYWLYSDTVKQLMVNYEPS